MSSDTPRAPRLDAQLNREKLLVAAGELIGEHGIDVPLYLVARRAGVGNGTLHRNFPDRGSLLGALTFRASALFADVVGPAVAIPDSREALITYLDGVIELTLRNPWIDPVLAHARKEPPAGWRPGRWIAASVDLVARAQRDGVLRPDVHTTDIAFIAPVLTGLATLPEPIRSIVLARQRALILDALRPEGEPRPALAPIPLSMASFLGTIHPPSDDGDASTGEASTGDA